MKKESKVFFRHWFWFVLSVLMIEVDVQWRLQQCQLYVVDLFITSFTGPSWNAAFRGCLSVHSVIRHGFVAGLTQGRSTILSFVSVLLLVLVVLFVLGLLRPNMIRSNAATQSTMLLSTCVRSLAL